MGGWTEVIRGGGWLTRERVRGYGLVLLVVELLFFAVCVAGTHGWIVTLERPASSDFVSFYAAGALADAGTPALAYDQAAHYAAEQRATEPGIIYNFFYYPPVFLLLCAPLARLPYLAAFIGFQLGCLVPLMVLVRRIVGPAPLGTLLAFPAVFWAVGTGQNALLTAGLLAGGMLALPRQPLVAGLLLGAVCYKPHLALLVPVALVAGGYWRAIAGVAMAVAAMVAASVAAFGLGTWQAFLVQSAAAGSVYASAGAALDLAGLTSPYGLTLALGGRVGVAIAVQAVVMLGVMAGVVWVWGRRYSVALKAAVLLAAIPVAVPVVMFYDLMLTGVALAWVIRDGREHGFAAWQRSGLAVAFVLPLVSGNSGFGSQIGIPPLEAALGLTLALRQCAMKSASFGDSCLDRELNWRFGLRLWLRNWRSLVARRGRVIAGFGGNVSERLMLPFRLGSIVAAALIAVSAPAGAQGVLTVAMTAGDIPVTGGNPDQGFEGFRFVGLTLYDALINWDLSSADKPADLKPGLATEWKTDPADRTKWLFTLRDGVKFHDGCPMNADAVVWNFGRFDEKAPQWNPQQFALARAYLPNFLKAEKVDDKTVALYTKVPSSLFPYEMSFIVMTSKCRAEAVKYDWAAYGNQPSGTGPYKFDKMVPHERLELIPNTDYWDKSRIPKQERLVLLPMPEASTRTAALLSGQVNFVEAPSPDALPRLKSSGMRIVTNKYPHVWAYQLNTADGPFKDVRVRQAANYAINRDDVVELLGGLALPATTAFPPGTAWGDTAVPYTFDVPKAKALLKEAGCVPCKVTFAISTSGSGQMQPLPMNELIKSQLEDAGFQVTLQVMDWNALLALSRVPPPPGVDANNVSRSIQDPIAGMTRFTSKAQWSPNGSNWGHYYTPEMEDLITEAFNEFDPAKRLEILKKMDAKMVADAPFIWVVHDLNPRALSPKVKGFVQAQSWFQDLTPITVDK